MANSIQQIAAVTAMNLRSVPARLGTSMVIVVGIAGVVGVMVALFAMAEGFRSTLAGTGRADRAIVLRGGSNDELGSVVFREQAQILMDAAGVRRDADGKPLALPEIYMLTDVPKDDSPGPNNVVVRGTAADVFKLRPEARIVAGRMFQPGVREVVVGKGAAAQFPRLAVGATVDVRDGPWTIVGVFETGGDVHESELWVDQETLRLASRRNAYNSVTVQLDGDAAFQTFKDAITADPRLTLQVQREPDYYASRSKALNDLITILGYTVAVIMGIGALFGALNTMYAAVATRTVEIATLRAIGFGAAPVVLSVLIEALLLALAGSVVGGAAAYVFFNGYTVNTLNFQTFSQVAFAFRVTPGLLVQGAVWACAIGALGGLFPAVRAARLPVVEALRAA
ncbi:MAG: ABC transporter permease [Gammaproteobacteria bacterium]|nr:ABC transporter permease [Gammaproteobacteria bacterium]